MSLRPGTVEGRTSRSGATAFSPVAVTSAQPRTRLSSADRRPPIRALAQEVDDDADEAEMWQEDEHGENKVAHQHGASKGSGVKWETRMARRYKRWGPVIDTCHSSLVTHHPLALDLKGDVSQYHLQRVQDGALTWWKTHTCCQREDGVFDDSVIRIAEQRDVTMISHAGYGSLKIPLWECKNCQERFGPNPSAFACFPSTPTVPAYWVDVDLHNQFSTLAMYNTSCTGDW